MSIEQTTVHGWPGFLLAGDHVRVGVVPCPGGRIASLCHDGEELLFVQPEYRGARADIDGDLQTRKGELGFRVWGGNKTWVAPQHAWLDGTPPLDLDAGEYRASAENDAVTLVSPICRETGLEVTRRISLNNDVLSIEHTLSNPGPEAITRGVWDVTQWLRPFDVYFAGSARPYPEEGTTEELMRGHVGEDGDWTRVNARAAAQFKVGARVARGDVVALRASADETLVVRYRFDTDANASFAHDASVEIFNSADYPYLEIELHRALDAIPAGGQVSFAERIAVERQPGELTIADVT